MSKRTQTIFIIDDDTSVRNSLSLLLISSGYLTESYASPEEFLKMPAYHSEGCIILDIFMEGKSGLDIQEEIISTFKQLPIIYITGYGDVPMSVRALKKGAVNFLQKPVDDRVLLSAVEEALDISQALCQEIDEFNHLQTLLNALTPRELQVYRLLVTGLLNKQIGSELGITEHTVKLHRGKITEKLGIKSVAELVNLAQKLKLA